MAIQTEPNYVTEVLGQVVAITWLKSYTRVDPRAKHAEILTTCLVRPLSGPKELFVGATICSPKDISIEATGHKVSLGRALHEYLNSPRFGDRPFYAWRQCYSLARRVYRMMKDEAEGLKQYEAGALIGQEAIHA